MALFPRKPWVCKQAYELIMNGRLSQLVLLACLLSCAACSTSNTVRRTVGGVGERPLLDVSVRSLPGCPVKPARKFLVMERMNSQGLVDVQVAVANPSSSAKKFRYSWQWMGPDALSTTDPAREVWRTGFIEGNDTATLSSTSTVPDPSSVMLRISPSP
jgi:hypothetical protein